MILRFRCGCGELSSGSGTKSGLAAVAVAVALAVAVAVAIAVAGAAKKLIVNMTQFAGCSGVQLFGLIVSQTRPGRFVCERFE